MSQQISTEPKNKHGIFKGEDSYIALEVCTPNLLR